MDSRSALHRYITTPVLRYAFDAETGHKLSVAVLRSGAGPRDIGVDGERSAVHLWDKAMSNPIGLAAGFDKDGEAIDGLFNLGFSWVEVGSVTPKAQPGNPQPRVFHLTSDSALINRYGFPSQGHAAMISRLQSRVAAALYGRSEEQYQDLSPNRSLRDGKLLAINLGKNKASEMENVDDFVKGVRAFGEYADVLVVNISSPNTPGLRGLQNKDHLTSLLSSVVSARDSLKLSHKPRLVLKLAPDLDEEQIVGISEVIRASGIDGVILGNTTIQRPSHLSSPAKAEIGGLSGAPLFPLGLKTLRSLRAQLPASVPIIGCGGISSGADALEYARAGASMVQVYTAFGYDGPGACRRIKDEVERELLEKEGGKTWEEVVKKAVAEFSWKEPKSEKKTPPAQEKGGNDVRTLIEEAEKLKEMLDKFAGDKLEKLEAVVVPVPLNPAESVPATVV